MAKPVKPVQNEQPNSWGFETLVTRLYHFVETLESNKRVIYGIIWLAIAIILTVAASLPLAPSLHIVSVIVGFPSGVILFALILSVIHTTQLKDMTLFQYKEYTLPKNRIAAVIIGFLIVIVLLIISTPFIPTGVGGMVIILAALSAYNIIRRTKTEISYANQGLPDPRELGNKDDE